MTRSFVILQDAGLTGLQQLFCDYEVRSIQEKMNQSLWPGTSELLELVL